MHLYNSSFFTFFNVNISSMLSYWKYISISKKSSVILDHPLYQKKNSSPSPHTSPHITPPQHTSTHLNTPQATSTHLTSPQPTSSHLTSPHTHTRTHRHE